MPYRLSLLLGCATLSFAFAGCDYESARQNPRPMAATGRVVLAGTDEPVVGLSVALVELVIGVDTARDQTYTDTDGRFIVRFDPPEMFGPPPGYYVRVNYPFSEEFVSQISERINPGETLDLGTVELERALPP